MILLINLEKCHITMTEGIVPRPKIYLRALKYVGEKNTRGGVNCVRFLFF